MTWQTLVLFLAFLLAVLAAFGVGGDKGPVRFLAVAVVIVTVVLLVTNLPSK